MQATKRKTRKNKPEDPATFISAEDKASCVCIQAAVIKAMDLNACDLFREDSDSEIALDEPVIVLELEKSKNELVESDQLVETKDELVKSKDELVMQQLVESEQELAGPEHDAWATW